MEHFSYDCLECHSNDGGGQTVFGRSPSETARLAPSRTQNKSDGELYYTIENGVRLSGMPAFHGTHTVPQTWPGFVDPALASDHAQELNEMKGGTRRMRRIQRISKGGEPPRNPAAKTHHHQKKKHHENPELSKGEPDGRTRRQIAPLPSQGELDVGPGSRVQTSNGSPRHLQIRNQNRDDAAALVSSSSLLKEAT